MGHSRGPWIVCGLLVLVSLLTFLPVRHHEFLVYDDPGYVTENPRVRAGLTWAGIQWAFTTIHASDWQPLAFVSHMLDCQLFGLDASKHHLVNVFLHAANAVLLFLVLRRLTGALWQSGLVAGLFAWHPLRVESVAWVAERKGLLCAFFGLLTLLMYARYAHKRSNAERQTERDALTPSLSHRMREGVQRTGEGSFDPSGHDGSGAPDSGPWTLDYGLALVFFALGLMSKPALVALPFALLLLDYWPLQRVSPASFRVSDWGRMVREKWPFFALTAASCVVTFVAMRRSGSVAPLASLSLPYRVENALLSYALYLGETIWPANLVLPRLLHKEIPWVQVAGATALLSGITWATWRARRQKPCLLVGWLWFLGMLVPVIGLVQQGLQAMADRYTYLPQIGLFLGVVFALGDWARAWHLRPAILILAAAAVLAGFQTATARQLRWWQDSETLFRHTLAVTKENHMASFNLGLALYGKGRVDEAIQCFRDVLKVLPDDVETHNDLAVALLKSGRRDEAVVHLRQAVALRPGNAEARCNLANVLLHMGQVDAAIAEYQKTLEYQPNFAGAHNNLGIVWFQQGKLDAAIAQFRETLRIDPGFVAAYGNLAEALLQKGRVDEAVTYYRKAVELQPDSAPARAGLAEALRREKTPGENLVLSTNGATNSPPATNRGGAIPAD